MTQSQELPYWLALRRAGLGSRNFSLLVRHFGNIETAWNASLDEVAAAGLDRLYLRGFTKARSTFDGEMELELLVKHGVRAYTWLDDDYPASLREIPQSPPVLFVRGKLGPQFEQAVAVVGTRRVTPYGRQATEAFCEAIARTGVAVISGLARGVDSIAHRVALEHGAPTVAVLAGGIDKVYPRENLGLAERIQEQGCLVSEYPAGIPARPDYFPRRNRILSGLAKATLVVEAGEGSGALHTANWAFEQGRDVFAIPGPIFSRQSAGTNQLIRESTAKLVATPEQLCEELNLLAVGGQVQLLEQPSEAPDKGGRVAPQGQAGKPATTPEEGKMLHWLQDAPKHIDEIVRASGLPVALVSSTLQLMELKGLVRQERPMVYAMA
ncbi:MAG: DNA-processing protein DprA [Dehalococcoidia bacterium]|nr:DNA-processing protein DprA [Dehalococcoidia bacterium]